MAAKADTASSDAREGASGAAAAREGGGGGAPSETAQQERLVAHYWRWVNSCEITAIYFSRDCFSKLLTAARRVKLQRHTSAKIASQRCEQRPVARNDSDILKLRPPSATNSGA